jgi:hypothetical protein
MLSAGGTDPSSSDGTDMTPLESLIGCGTKLWLDSVDPDLVIENRQYGVTGATSNPIIISNLVRTGRFDAELKDLVEELSSDEDVAWQLTDRIVRRAQEVFLEAGQGGRRLRQLRTRSAPGRQVVPAVPGREEKEICRTGGQVVDRAQEPDDQGASD